jgi:hypothetical protein
MKELNLIDKWHDSPYWLTRLCLQRGLALIYVIGFLIAINQGPGLIGSHGILPAEKFIGLLGFWSTPSLYFWDASDATLMLGNGLGLFLAIFALSGYSERFGAIVSALVWFLMWLLYLSLVNIGQIFYGYGWEIMLCEAGFLAVFLGSQDMAPPKVIIWMYRWLVFRLMFGAGLIKIRGDECWRDFTCMIYHYETQPLPNPLSRSFHHLPVWYHKFEVAMTHFSELLVPFGLFGPKNLRRFCGAITILFQVSLIISGNLSWLNYITVVVTFSCLDDDFLLPILRGGRKFIPATLPRMSSFRLGVLLGLSLILSFLSLAPMRNLLAAGQIMNTSFDPFHLVNTYGAFGSITRVRNEIILEGTKDKTLSPSTKWKAYEFRCKPGDVMRIPCLVSPYHYKIDWQMWFAAMAPPAYSSPWLAPFLYRLLEGEPTVTKLLLHNPFEGTRPQYLRARLLEYHFTNSGQKGVWKATPKGEWFTPISLSDFTGSE